MIHCNLSVKPLRIIEIVQIYNSICSPHVVRILENRCKITFVADVQLQRLVHVICDALNTNHDVVEINAWLYYSWVG